MILKISLTIFILVVSMSGPGFAQSNVIEGADLGKNAVFDDLTLINGYSDKFAGESKETLLAMIADDSLGVYRCAAAVRVFKQKYATEIFKDEKPEILKNLIRRLNRTDSPYVQVEIMHTLIVLDRYQYFEAMVPALIQKLDHYNRVVSALTYDNLEEITKTSTRPREARIVFKTLRKIFFLSKNRLADVTTPDARLKRKLMLLRWSIKVLGTQLLKSLPPEVVNLL